MLLIRVKGEPCVCGTPMSGCEYGKVRGYAGVCVDVRFGYVWMFVGDRACVFCNCVGAGGVCVCVCVSGVVGGLMWVYSWSVCLTSDF